MPKVIYTGLFLVNPSQVLDKFPPKFEKIYAHHITLKFRPSGLHGITPGKKHLLKIVGYVVDEDIGIEACITENIEGSQKNYPHVTISAKNGIPPKKSSIAIENAIKNNEVSLVSPPIEIAVVEGYFDGKKVVIN